MIVKTDSSFNYEDSSMELVEHVQPSQEVLKQQCMESNGGQHESNSLQEETNVGKSDSVKLHFKSKKYV